MARRGKNKKPGLITGLLWLINLAFSLLLLGSYLAAYVDPGITTFFAFLGLAYPFLLLANVLFFLLWLFRGKRKLLLPLLVILAGYNPLANHIQLLPGSEASHGKEHLKVLSYNVQNLSHSNYGGEQSGIRELIQAFIRSEQADICCLQEFSGIKPESGEAMRQFVQEAGFSKYSMVKYNPGNLRRSHSIVILTKLPVIAGASLSLPGETHNFGAFVDLAYLADTIRVYNLHLESIRLHHDDYQFFEDVSKGQTEKGSFGEGSKSILRKLHHAFKIRARQSRVVENSIASSPHPVILCGDFNDTPASFAYNKIRKGLKDAFVQAGFGMGYTFAGKLPPQRIDYILHSAYFTAEEYQVHHSDYSDHYPVSVLLRKE